MSTSPDNGDSHYYPAGLNNGQIHVGAFEGSVLRKHWERFESRLEDNIGKGLQGTHPEELRADMRRSKAALEAAGANRIVGYRAGRNWLKPKDLWVLDTLAEEGYLHPGAPVPYPQCIHATLRDVEQQQQQQQQRGGGPGGQVFENISLQYHR